MSHCVLPPSSGSMWANCTKWLGLQKTAPKELKERTNPTQNEGQAAHKLAAMMLRWKGKELPPAENHIGKEINGVVVTQEMWDNCLIYVEAALLVGAKHIEEKINIGFVHPEIYGTPDFWSFNATKNVVHVIDLKYGFGFVEAYRNVQLLLYAIGVCEKLNLSDETSYVLTIVQPRSFGQNPVRSWTVTGLELRNWTGKFNNAANLNIHNMGQCKTGNHCRYCAARTNCGALLADVSKLYDTVLDTGHVDVELPVLYGQLKSLELKASAIQDGLEEVLKCRMKSGERFKGLQLKPKVGNRKWSVPENVVKFTAEMNGIDITEKYVMSPNKAEKAGLDKEITKQLTKRESKGFDIEIIDSEKMGKVFNV